MHKHMLALIDRLHAATIAGKTNWEKTGDDGGVGYQAGEYRVVLAPKDKSLELQLVDTGGAVLEEIDKNKLGDAALAGGMAAGVALDEIYALARRQASGVDAAISAVIDHLDTVGADGAPAQADEEKAPPPDTSDETPPAEEESVLELDTPQEEVAVIEMDTEESPAEAPEETPVSEAMPEPKKKKGLFSFGKKK